MGSITGTLRMYETVREIAPSGCGLTQTINYNTQIRKAVAIQGVASLVQSTLLLLLQTSVNFDSCLKLLGCVGTY
jgi:hypothetical protein